MSLEFPRAEELAKKWVAARDKEECYWLTKDFFGLNEEEKWAFLSWVGGYVRGILDGFKAGVVSR